jgi:hypothetical protein
MKIRCPQCRKWSEVDRSAVIRAKKDGYRKFCGRKCSGLARRKYIPPEVKKARKRDYDVLYRAKNLARIKANKAAYYQRTRDPEKERIERKKRMPNHVEYCRRPQYRQWKQGYDLKYRAKRLFGPFAEAALVLRDVEMEIDRRMTWVERHQANGTLNKSTQRKRDYAIQTGRPYPR